MILSIFHIEKFCLFFKLYLRSRPPLSFRAKNGYPSGWRKRKTKEDKLKKAELAASKSHKMTEFFTQQRDDRNTSSSRPECEGTSNNQKLLKKKTPEKETVEKDASPTVKYPNDLGTCGQKLWARLTVSPGYFQNIAYFFG